MSIFRNGHQAFTLTSPSALTVKLRRTARSPEQTYLSVNPFFSGWLFGCIFPHGKCIRYHSTHCVFAAGVFAMGRSCTSHVCLLQLVLVADELGHDTLSTARLALSVLGFAGRVLDDCFHLSHGFIQLSELVGASKEAVMTKCREE